MSNLPTSHGVPFRSAISAARALAHDVVGEMGCGKQHGNLRPGAWIEEDLAEVFLVGHSYAGMVITGVAAKAAERLKLLIYLDAYIPADGQSESDLWSPERRAIAEAAEAAASGLAQPPPPALFGVTDPALAAWITARMTPHPVATYTEPAPPGNATSAAVPRVFIHCTAIPPTTPDVFGPFAATARAKSWPVREIATGHPAMLTAPRELAGILQELAG